MAEQVLIQFRADKALKQEVSDIYEQLGMDLPTAAAVYNFVTTAISQVSGFHAEIVSALPSTGESNILYLVAKSTAGASDAYDEYLYINGAWECVGSTSMDLSGYVKTAEMHEITNAEITAIVNEVWS